MAGLVASKITLSISIVFGCLGKWSGKKDAGKAPPSPLFYRIDEEGHFLDHIFYFDGTNLCVSGGSMSPRSRGGKGPVYMASASLTAVASLGWVLFYLCSGHKIPLFLCGLP